MWTRGSALSIWSICSFVSKSGSSGLAWNDPWETVRPLNRDRDAVLSPGNSGLLDDFGGRKCDWVSAGSILWLLPRELSYRLG